MYRLVILNNVPILEQLQLEEALLRTSQENWFLLNTGSPDAIVMGISGKPYELLDVQRVHAKQIPVLKRFSGGGTVYIDPQTIFATFIGNQNHVPMQPKPLLEWSESFYAPVFPGFSLRENDYVLGEKKIGGNAQYIQKTRWLLHTSFLWDYSLEKMECLLLPQKRPTYRQDRSHADFLRPLHPLFPNKKELITQLKNQAENMLEAQLTDPEEAWAYLKRPHRKATIRINIPYCSCDGSQSFN